MHTQGHEELRKSEATARALLESAAEGIVIVGSNGRIVLANARAEKMFGYSREELHGQTLEVLLPERLRAVHGSHRAGYFTEPHIRPMGLGLDLAGRRKDGTEFPVEISLSYIETDDGLLAMAFVTDITERRRAERRQSTLFAVSQFLADSGSLSEATTRLLQATCEGIGWDLGELWTVDPARNVLRWDGIWHRPTLDVADFVAVSRGTTFSRGDGLAGRVWASGEPAWISDVLADACFQRMSAAARVGLHAALAFPIPGERELTGVMVFFSRQVHPPDDDLLKIMADIGQRIGQFADRKRAEEKLRESEAKSRAILDTVVDGIITIDERGIVESVNPAAARIFGFAPSEVIGQNVNMLMPEPYHSEHDGYLANYLKTGEKKIIGIGREVVGRRKDGSTFPMDIAVSEVHLADRRIFTGIVRDVTERKRAEEALARQAQDLLRLADEAHVREAFVRNVVESIQDGIVVLDRQGRIAGWNRAMEERCGIPGAEVQGLGILEVFPSLSGAWFDAGLVRILEEDQEVTFGGIELETRHRGRVTMNIKGSPLRTLTAEVAGAVLTLEDVTERVRLERIARQSEKMAAVGSLAAGIAHEINNPIGVITARVELMLMEAREKGLPAGVTRDLQVIEKHAGRVAKITQGLLSFSRHAPWKLTDMDVNQVVEEALLLVEKQLTKERITLKKNLAPGLPTIAGSPNHLEQVLVNLLTNAREAMVSGGTILVESRRAHEMIEIRVADTGPGIPPEVMARIFDPFFTTKEEGTGLGLSISYGIVREHGGTITIESRPGGGSIFIVQLPVRGASVGEGAHHGERANPRH
jgi:two-component system cell cycle sensor histidine kinase/response regulator CckA